MNHILPIIMWQSWLKSLAALVGYILASYYAAYWPAFACWITAAFMIRNKTLKGYDRFMANKSMTSGLDKSGKLVLLEVEEAADDDVEQQEFGGLIKTFTRMSPGWVKEMAAGFQPTVKTIVDGVALARNIILWKHELSKKAFYGLLAGGVVLCFLPFWILVMAAGAGVLLANSPIKGLSIGFAKYAARWVLWHISSLTLCNTVRLKAHPTVLRKGKIRKFFELGKIWGRKIFGKNFFSR
ncbi:extended synaptotagmin-like protein [Perkinsus olseni]|uniref:Extended synaptotagmin-like protein n=1 Tax=Perkinsus olseni TaxID=32597 RepID=A0A7J6QBV5_PEROL|nr:extended synaptotagmin-like protein [Perkinsus olseni]